MTLRLRLIVYADQRRVVILPHATVRYAERVSRHDSLATAAAELEMLLCAHGHVQPNAPCWVYATDPHQRTVAWLLLGDDIAFPLERSDSGTLGAMTCLCRFGLADLSRRRRTRRRGHATGKKASGERRERRDLLIPTYDEEAA